MPLVVPVIDGVVAPVDHKYVEPGDAVSVTLPPAQNVVGPPGVIVAAGEGLTVTVNAEDVPTHPVASVTVTLYAPVAVTVIDCVVSLFGDQ